MAYKYIYLESGTQWEVPIDWNDSDNYIECYGGGASGASGAFCAGGGGGAYALRRNLSLKVGTTVNYQVGAGGAQSSWSSIGTAGGNTWFNGTNYGSSSCAAPGGAAATYPGGPTAFGGVGGQASACRGGNGVTTSPPAAGYAYSGGNGGSSSSYSGGGGGGAAGPGGNGFNGSSDQNQTTGGAGGAGGGYPSSGAGAGGAGGNSKEGSAGGNGGAGGGGGGGGSTNSLGYSGGNGGFWGAGGGGSGFSNFNYTSSRGGAGAPGIIVVAWNPIAYQLPASGSISMNDINNIWFANQRSFTLGDPEIRYLIESGAFNPTNMPLPPLSNIDLNTALGKPSPAGGSVSYTTAGTYTFYVPIYKYFSAVINGAGGGEGGGAGSYATCTGCGCTVGAGACGLPCLINVFTYYPCSGIGYHSAPNGLPGGQSGITYLNSSGATVNIGSANGGSGGQGIQTNNTANDGTPGSGTINIGSGRVITGGGSQGGTGNSNGGAGGAGGSVELTIQYYVTSGYPIWANSNGVTRLTLTVGAGGQGGEAGTGGTPGANGQNGNITINWR